MNAETRLAELLESEWVPTNKSVLFADITEAVGLESTALVVGTIKAASAQNPLMETILIAMSTVGLSLSTAERQGVIDSLAIAGQWPDAVRDAVKALGGVTRPKWVGAGYVSEPTLEQIQKELIVSDTRTAVNSKTTAINAWLDAYDVSDKSVAEVQAYVDSLLASQDGNP